MDITAPPFSVGRFPNFTFCDQKTVDGLGIWYARQVQQQPDQAFSHNVVSDHLNVGECLFSYRPKVGTVVQVLILQTESGFWLASGEAYERESFLLSEALRSVIRLLLGERNLQAFFAGELRTELFREAAIRYGLAGASDLEQYFRLEMSSGQPQVVPCDPALLAADADWIRGWSKTEKEPNLLDIQPQQAVRGETQQVILVIGRQKFNRNLYIGLHEVSLTKNGALKDPVRPRNVLDWLSANQDERKLRFALALQRFQLSGHSDDPAADIDALSKIAENPFSFPLYVQQEEASGVIRARTLKRFDISIFMGPVEVSVKPGNFLYAVDARLGFREQLLSMSELSFAFNYFIRKDDDTLFVVPDFELFRFLRLLKEHKGSLALSKTQYPLFRNEVLSRIEEYVRPVPDFRDERVLEESGGLKEKILYLEDFGDFITLTPVIRYGEQEVQIRNRSAVQLIDHRGKRTWLKRDNKLEKAFQELLSAQHPFFAEQVELELPYFFLHRKRFLENDWLVESLQLWQQEGITIYGFNELKGNVLNPAPLTVKMLLRSGKDWFNAKLDIRSGGRKAATKSLRAAIRDGRKYVRLDDGSWGILPEEWMERFKVYFNIGELIREDELQFHTAQFNQFDQWFEPESISPEARLRIDGLKRLVSDFRADLQPPPERLMAQLKPYQLEGYNWLLRMDEAGLGACLADEMGLGKTLQVIAFLLALKERQGTLNALIVLPTSLLGHWQEELSRFAPALNVLAAGAGDAEGRRLKAYDVVLFSYGRVVRQVHRIRRFTFDYIVLDESQQIKNTFTQRYSAIRQLKGRGRLVLSGTPVENNVMDLYAQLSFANPGLLGSVSYFHDVYLRPISQFQHKARLEALKEKIKPFFLRRTKDEVLPDLPEKKEWISYCEMPSRQRELYTLYEREFRDYISAVDDEELDRQRMNVLRGITRLRQLCNSPVLLGEGRLPGDESAKLDWLMNDLSERIGNHKVLIFSSFVSMLDLIRIRLETAGIEYSMLTGSTVKRAEIVEAFKSEEKKRVFLISLKAGGTGLNLVEASYVYLFEPWWNPAVEQQAIDRAHRVGQHRPVSAVKLVCRNSVEEKMLELQAAKSDLFEQLIGSASGKLTKASILNLLSSEKPDT